jgi:ATP-binding protein involved in chromosome partitioning
MAFFQENEEEAIIWRGPMVHNAINQFLQTTAWGDLDYLVVDLPPGTSDAPLTVMQTLSLDGFVVVTSPQALAKLDAKRSINMIRKLNVKVLGVVENFTGEMFGTGAGEELAQEMGLTFMGSLGLRPDYMDMSKPAVLSSPLISAEYENIVQALEPAIAANQTA